MAELLTTAQLALYLQVAVVTLATWRSNDRRDDLRRAAGEKVSRPHRGPPYIYVGERNIRYDKAAVDAWLASIKRP